MKKIYTVFTGILCAVTMHAQTPQIPNGDFETWEGSSSTLEPTNFNSNKTGSSLAAAGPQTCYQETTSPHGGTYCVRMETKYYILAVVNGSMTTGVVNAPSTNKALGYIGTINYSSSSDIRRMAFNGRPDSLVGWFKYSSGGTSAGIPEQGKVRAILHVGNYFDPETPVSGNHPDSTVNKIGDALFLTPITNVSGWTRFSVPFSYVDGRTPEYIMINCTPSNNQMTTVPGSGGTGSMLWLDDLAVIYNPAGVNEQNKVLENVKVYCFDHVLYADYLVRNHGNSVLQVFDITGKQILTKQLNNDQLNTVALPGIAEGLYVYKLTTADGAGISGKFVIQ